VVVAATFCVVVVCVVAGACGLELVVFELSSQCAGPPLARPLLYWSSTPFTVDA
jgi:hypothetical protein